MAKELLRLKQSLVNKPLLATTELADFAFDLINERGLSQKLEEAGGERDGGYYNPVNLNLDTKSAVINLDGAMTYKPTFMQALCGGVSYQGLISDFASVVNSGATTVVFMVDSGGGEAYQCFETANEIRKIADEYDVHILAAVDGMSASAAYALTSVADEIVMFEGSEVGSIGVVVRLMNDSGALGKEGYERTFICAGEDKVPYDKDGGFSESFLADIQEKVDETYLKFVDHIAFHRGLSKDLIKGTQANTFTSVKALELGLVDKVMTPYEFMDYSADYIQIRNGGEMPLRKFINNEDVQMDVKELTAANKLLTTEKAALLADFETVKAELAVKSEELQETLSMAAQAKEELETLKEEVETAKVEARRAKLSEVLAEDKVEAMMTSLSNLSEEAFYQVADTFAVTREAAKDTEMFQSLGTSTHAATLEEDETEEDLTLKILKERNAQ